MEKLKKIKRLTNRSTFFTVMDAAWALGYNIIPKQKGYRSGFSITFWKKAENDKEIFYDKFIERKDLIEWLNLVMEEKNIIEREEPEP